MLLFFCYTSVILQPIDAFIHLQGFANHVRTEHNMWAYIFFFIHLDDTKPNDYTALELYVYDLVSLQDILQFGPNISKPIYWSYWLKFQTHMGLRQICFFF